MRKVVLTHHVRHRMDGREIPRSAIEAAVRECRGAPARGGATAYQVGYDECAACPELAEWHSLRVIVARDGAVLSAYRRRAGEWRPKWAGEAS